MIRFHCLQCGMLIQAREAAVGRAAKCPGCGAVLEIPQASTPIPPPPPKSAPIAPPIASPPAPDMVPEMAAQASSESLSLDELLGSASAAAPMTARASGSTAGADHSKGTMNAKKNGKKTAGRAGAKVSTATKHGKAASKSGATAIRNLSIAAIVTGVLGLALFAVPYAGVVIGLIGVAIGCYAVSLASARHNSLMGLALVGAAVSVVAAGLGGYRIYRGSQTTSAVANAQQSSSDSSAEPTGQLAADANGSGDFSKIAGAAVKAAVAGAVADARNPLNLAMAAVRGAAADPAKAADRLALASGKSGAEVAPAARRVAGPLTLRVQDPNDKSTSADMPPSADGVSAGDAAPTAAKAAPIRWAAADQAEAQGNDDVRVTVTKVVTGTVFFHDGGNVLLDGHETSVAYLHVGLKIQNNQPVGNVDYKSWMTLPAAAVKLTADNGAEVPRFEVAKEFLSGQQQNVTLDEVHLAHTIELSQSFEDTLIFHLPAAGAEPLRLKLSGRAVGLSDDLYFTIPRSMIKAAETGNPLLPSAAP